MMNGGSLEGPAVCRSGGDIDPHRHDVYKQNYDKTSNMRAVTLLARSE